MSSFAHATKKIVQNYRIPESSDTTTENKSMGFMSARDRLPEPKEMDIVAKIMTNIRKEREKLKNG